MLINVILFIFISLVNIYSSVIRRKILKDPSCVRKEDGYIYLYGHNRKSFIDGIHNNILTSGMVILAFLVYYSSKSATSGLISNTGNFFIIVEYIVILFLIILQLVCSIYGISEIKHVADGYMINPNFFKKYAFLSFIYFCWTSAISLTNVNPAHFVVLLFLVAIIFYLGMGDLLQFKTIYDDKGFVPSQALKECAINIVKFIFSNNYRKSAIAEANRNIKLIAKALISVTKGEREYTEKNLHVQGKSVINALVLA